MKRFLLTLLFVSVSLFAEEIRIAAAANVSYAVADLKREFAKSHPDTKITVTVGSSGKLAAQIKNGAPYGIFLSADMRYPHRLYEEGIAATEPTVYARGLLVYFSVKPRDFSTGMALLERASVRTIAVANPKTAPYGAAAAEAMKKAGLYEKVKRKLVYGESVSQTVSYVLKAADIGLVAKSALYGPQMSGYREGVNWAEVDRKLYRPIKQGAVLLERGRKSPGCSAFYRFLFSDKAKRVFKKYGYITE